MSKKSIPIINLCNSNVDICVKKKKHDKIMQPLKQIEILSISDIIEWIMN